MPKKKLAKKKKKSVTVPTWGPGDPISCSRLLDWQDCRQRAQYKADGWTSPRPRAALDFGTLFHSFLQDLYDRVHRKEITRPLTAKQLASLFDVLSEDSLENLFSHVSSAEEVQQIEDMIVVAKPLFVAYCMNYPKDFQPGRWVGTELSFKTKWKGYTLHGRIDGVLKIKNKLWLLETKTKGRIEEGVLTDALAFDFQSLFYILCAELERKQKVQGVLYNVVRRPGLKQKKTEIVQGLVDRISEDIQERPEHYFKRYEIKFDRATRQSFEQDLGHKVSEFTAWLEGRIPTYKNEASCTGKWTCEFLSACASRSMAGFIKRRLRV